MFRIARYSSAAAAAVFLAVAAGWLFLMDRTAPRAFADVVEKVKNAKSVTFITKIPTVVEGTKQGTLQQKVYIQGDSYRMEFPSAQGDGIKAAKDAPPIVLAFIVNSKERKAIQLDFVRKTARIIETDDKQWQAMAQQMFNPIEKLRNLKNEEAELLGDEVSDNRRVQVYRLKKPELFLGLRVGKDDTAKLWVDFKSGLPVRLAIGDPANKDKPSIVFEQFAWNEPLDPELFKLDVPTGFTVEKLEMR
jgi:outer membrane lipoprotein-sorting protein